jgi:hypothetical protein
MALPTSSISYPPAVAFAIVSAWTALAQEFDLAHSCYSGLSLMFPAQRDVFNVQTKRSSHSLYHVASFFYQKYFY